MRAVTRRQGLVVVALLLTPTMFVLVPLITGYARPVIGYVLVLVTYWLGFCLPVAVVFSNGPRDVSIRVRNRPIWIPIAALILPAATFIAAGSSSVLDADARVVVLAVSCAAINAPLEELAWRRSFRAISNSSPGFELLGLLLFVLWHVPLGFSYGVCFDYGLVGLAGGALFHGTAWTLMTRMSDSVGWPIVSHVLVNLAAFLPFFATNFAAAF